MLIGGSLIICQVQISDSKCATQQRFNCFGMRPSSNSGKWRSTVGMGFPCKRCNIIYTVILMVTATGRGSIPWCFLQSYCSLFPPNSSKIQLKTSSPFHQPSRKKATTSTHPGAETKNPNPNGFHGFPRLSTPWDSGTVILWSNSSSSSASKASKRLHAWVQARLPKPRFAYQTSLEEVVGIVELNQKKPMDWISSNK